LFFYWCGIAGGSKMIAKIGSISAVLLMLSISVAACGKEPNKEAASLDVSWVPREMNPQLPPGSRRLTTDELRVLLPGKKIVPVERILSRWDECDERFTIVGGWFKCTNPNSEFYNQYVSKKIDFKNDMFCVFINIKNTYRCSYIYIDKKNNYYINNFYKKIHSSLIMINIKTLD
jgi:hypothetical protein